MKPWKEKHESAFARVTGRQPARLWVMLASNRRRLLPGRRTHLAGRPGPLCPHGAAAFPGMQFLIWHHSLHSLEPARPQASRMGRVRNPLGTKPQTLKTWWGCLATCVLPAEASASQTKHRLTSHVLCFPFAVFLFFFWWTRKYWFLLIFLPK